MLFECQLKTEIRNITIPTIEEFKREIISLSEDYNNNLEEMREKYD